MIAIAMLALFIVAAIIRNYWNDCGCEGVEYCDKCREPFEG